MTGTVTFADTDLQYTNFTVSAGAVLTIPSGMVIRCSGTFTNAGTIRVLTGSQGGIGRAYDNQTLRGGAAHPDLGVSLRAPTMGEAATNPGNGNLFIGLGGVELTALQARMLRYPGAKAGGGGAFVGRNGIGGSGGGSLVVLSRGALSNTGTIEADGQDGLEGGGGAGGIIILASATSTTNSGTISAQGGVGTISWTSYAGSGGGGGGIVHLLAPAVTLGTVTVAGGAGGAISSGTPVAGGQVVQAGSGGGACGGRGGRGGSLSGGLVIGASEAGVAGHALTSTVDPTSLF